MISVTQFSSHFAGSAAVVQPRSPRRQAEIRSHIETLRDTLIAQPSSPLFAQETACRALTDICLAAPSSDEVLDKLYDSRLKCLSYFAVPEPDKRAEDAKRNALIAVDLLEAVLLADELDAGTEPPVQLSTPQRS